MSDSASTTADYKGIKTAEGLALYANLPLSYGNVEQPQLTFTYYSLTSEPIAVKVGEGATKTWHLPRELLIKASPFFAAALNGSFTEAISKSVNLPEDDTSAFALFVRWLYVGEISGKLFGSKDQSPILGVSSSRNGAKASLDASTKIYLQACILGDKLGCPIFHDLAMIEVLRCHHAEAITPETIRVVFENSAAGSKLRQFAIDELRLDISQSLCHNAGSYVSVAEIVEGFGLDFLKASLEMGGGKPINPRMHRRRYMQVLTVTEEG